MSFKTVYALVFFYLKLYVLILRHTSTYVVSCLAYNIIIFVSAAVVQLKTIAGALSADDTLSSSNVEKAVLLQKILVHVISIVCCFINLRLDVHGKVMIDVDNLMASVERLALNPEPFTHSRDPLSEKRLQWHQKAVISVMEAGGLNWLVGKVCIFSGLLS